MSDPERQQRDLSLADFPLDKEGVLEVLRTDNPMPFRGKVQEYLIAHGLSFADFFRNLAEQHNLTDSELLYLLYQGIPQGTLPNAITSLAYIKGWTKDNIKLELARILGGIQTPAGEFKGRPLSMSLVEVGFLTDTEVALNLPFGTLVDHGFWDE